MGVKDGLQLPQEANDLPRLQTRGFYPFNTGKEGEGRPGAQGSGGGERDGRPLAAASQIFLYCSEEASSTFNPAQQPSKPERASIRSSPTLQKVLWSQGLTAPHRQQPTNYLLQMFPPRRKSSKELSPKSSTGNKAFCTSPHGQ